MRARGPAAMTLPLNDDTLYELVGGDEPFARLVEAFYRGVETDELLRPMYPAELEGAKERLFLFLTQRFGGPRRYEALRGHPRLRMRHLPFAINRAARDAWLKHMRAAMETVGFEEPVRALLDEYFTQTADFMRNQPEPAAEG
jgi:hemoglobin